MQKICDSLNNAGQKTVRGNRFTVNSLRNILVNRAYIGEYKFGKILIPDGMPRLIDDETFQKAQSPCLPALCVERVRKYVRPKRFLWKTELSQLRQTSVFCVWLVQPLVRRKLGFSRRPYRKKWDRCWVR